jgi:hypothetical protein
MLVCAHNFIFYFRCCNIIWVSVAVRYQAATILKKLCFQQHALGDILQILHIVIVRKKWLVPHSSGWQPLSFNTVVVDTTGDATGEVSS